VNNKYIKLILPDLIGVTFCLYISFLLRFEFSVPNQFILIYYSWLPWFLPIQIITFYLSGLYNRIWRYTSLFDLYAILVSVLVSSLLSITAVLLMMGVDGYPRSVLLIYFILNAIWTSLSRLSIRVYFSHYHRDSEFRASTENIKKLLLIGAGKTGDKIAREIRSTSRKNYKIVGFVDDNPEKKGALLHGIKVYCGVNDLSNLKIHYDEIIITAPSASGDSMRRIVDACKNTGKRYQTVPGLNEQINSEVTIADIRDVSYSDLLGRDEVKLDMNSIQKLLKGKRVLITGAGGSIGSELVRQCLAFEPAEIITVDISEEKIYYLNQKIDNHGSKTILKSVLASVNSQIEMEAIFSENHPQIVFHAAALKHVPIQEVHPWAAINTNLGGTMNVVNLSDKYRVDKFVLVSTDKAVNPVNVMGATKRGSEKLIQSFNKISETRFMSVRFGNVLGSSGSAIPTFQDQINKGGPLTITHPEMTRYFMSIQEASQLILQSGALGNDGEIFLLEMGKPIKIVQMAKDLIRLSGLEPEVDIPIVYTGLRPGEKLYEELQQFDEKKIRTNHKKIMVLKDGQEHLAWPLFEKKLTYILEVAREMDADKIQLGLKDLLPSYKPRGIFVSSPVSKSLPYAIEGEA